MAIDHLPLHGKIAAYITVQIEIMWRLNQPLPLENLARVLLFSTILCNSTAASSQFDQQHPINTVQIHNKKDAPQIIATLQRDAIDGFNLRLKLRKFTIEAPEILNTKAPAQTDHGYANVYLNDQKFSRLYGTELHFPLQSFDAGINKIKITLNNHQHALLILGKTPIESVILIDPERDNFLLSQFSTSQVIEKNCSKWLFWRKCNT